jgi:N-acetylneuraminic acid mutarotase
VITRLLALAPLTLAALACNGDDGPTPAPTATQGERTPTPSPTITTDSPRITPAPAAKGWRTLAPMPTPRSEVAVAAVGGKIYVAGGFEGNGSTSDAVEVYDPATDTWTQAPPLPEPRHHTAAVGYTLRSIEGETDGRLLVIGGFGTTFSDPKNTLFEFSELTGAWAELPVIPSARGGLAAGQVGQVVYAVGGSDADQRSLTNHEHYAPGLQTWRSVASMSVPRDHLAAAAVGTEIFAIGGRSNVDFGQNLDANEEYDPQTDAWTERAALPTARSGIAAAALGGLIYVFGGEGSDGTFDENEAYDPATDTWETLEPMPTARHGLGAAVVGDTIYVIGGGETPGLSVSALNEAFTP